MIEEGDVWHYPYLWRWQENRGEAEGRKTRPCVLAVKVVAAGEMTRLFLLAITSKSPDTATAALRIPDIEKRRAGLASDLELWIILNEVNVDILETSFYLEPNGKVGSFSASFLKAIKSELLAQMKQTRLRPISRSDG